MKCSNCSICCCANISLRTLSGFGNRVVKYEQRFCNSEFGQLKLSPAELAVIATCAARAQTPASCTRIMHEFSDVSER